MSGLKYSLIFFKNSCIGIERFPLWRLLKFVSSHFNLRMNVSAGICMYITSSRHGILSNCYFVYVLYMK